MSSEADAIIDFDDKKCCASCGIAANDDIKLKNCTACHLVKYCGVNCQREHRPQHKRACKKRVAELQDEILFRQPESTHKGDCPICCLPIPINSTNRTENASVMSCCCKMICNGCACADQRRKGKFSECVCPFCRKPMTFKYEEIEMEYERRAEANDPVAMRQLGIRRLEKGDYKSAFEYWTKGAELGDAASHYELSVMYNRGEGVEKDLKKEARHLKEAAIAGNPSARHNLGCAECENVRFDRAVKHWIIAANLGYDKSMVCLKHSYSQGLVSKEDFESALRAHQAAVDATKSPQREAAAEIDRMRR